MVFCMQSTVLKITKCKHVFVPGDTNPINQHGEQRIFENIFTFRVYLLCFYVLGYGAGVDEAHVYIADLWQVCLE